MLIGRKLGEQLFFSKIKSFTFTQNIVKVTIEI